MTPEGPNQKRRFVYAHIRPFKFESSPESENVPRIAPPQHTPHINDAKIDCVSRFLAWTTV